MLLFIFLLHLIPTANLFLIPITTPTPTLTPTYIPLPILIPLPTPTPTPAPTSTLIPVLIPIPTPYSLTLRLGFGSLTVSRTYDSFTFDDSLKDSIPFRYVG